MAGALPRLPDDFLYGACLNPGQNETGLHNSDWWVWSHMKDFFGNAYGNGDTADGGTDFAHVNPDGTPGGHFKEQLAAAKKMGMNSFTYSLDWSRIQPTRDGPYDPAALRLYHALFQEMLKDGLKPIINIQHFVLPLWVYDPAHPDQSLGGWAGRGKDAPGSAPIVSAIARFAGDMAKEYGKEIKFWIPINEPMSDSVGRYFAGEFPGRGIPFDLHDEWKSVINMAYAHARMYDAIHANEPDAQVGVAQHLREYQPLRPGNASDIAAASQTARYMNQVFLDAITTGDADWNGDGKLDGPAEGKAVPALKNRADWLGINYYTRDKVVGFPFGLSLGWGGLKLRGLPISEIPYIAHFFQGPASDDSTEIYPQGMYDCLMWAQRQYHLPMMVTENGIADGATPDKMRPKFILDHVAEMQKAMKDGANVMGYQHWALTRTFEWQDGLQYDFGLLRVNMKDPNRSFTWTDGAKTYAEVIAAKGVTAGLEAQAQALAAGQVKKR